MFNINKPVAVYCRVSSDEQAERGTIENQRIFAEKYTDLHQLTIFKYYFDDGTTGTIPLQERPAGKELFKDARAGAFDLVLFYKLDRLGRKTQVILNAIYDLQEIGVNIQSMSESFDTTTPAGRFALTAFAGIAELERDNILSRMKQGSLRQAAKGKYLGGPVPYGYRLEDGYLVVNDEPIPGYTLSEADIIRLIFDMVVRQHKSTEQISDYLNSLNIPTRYKLDKIKVSTSGYWYPSRILSICHSSTYYGERYYGSTKIHQSNPAIISREEWEETQVALDRRQIIPKGKKQRKYLLKSLIKCQNCGCTYTGTAYKTAEGDATIYYSCNGRAKYDPTNGEKCPSRGIQGKWLEDMVWADCLGYINDPERILHKSGTAPAVDETAMLKTRLDELAAERSKILDLYRKNIISEADLTEQIAKIGAEQKQVNKALENKKAPATAEVYFNKLKEFQKYVKAGVSFDDKFYIIHQMVERIDINTVAQGRDIPKIEVSLKYKFHLSLELQGQPCNLNLRSYGDRLKYQRMLKGWSLKHLAEASNTAYQTISALERRGSCKLYIIKRLCTALEIDTDLITQASKMKSKTDYDLLEKYRTALCMSFAPFCQKIGLDPHTYIRIKEGKSLAWQSQNKLSAALAEARNYFKK